MRARVALCLERNEVYRTLCCLRFVNLKLQHRQQKRPERFFAHRVKAKSQLRAYCNVLLRVVIIKKLTLLSLQVLDAIVLRVLFCATLAIL